MAMKCPVCGGILEEKRPFSGDLRQKNADAWACPKCGYSTAGDGDLLAETVRRLQKEMEEHKDG